MKNDSQQIVTHCRSTVNTVTVSYQNCFYSYYCEIHLRRYIIWYCPLTYDNSLIFIMFYIKLSRNFAFLTNIGSFFCGILEHNVFAAVKEIHTLIFLINNNKWRNQITVTQTKQPLKDAALLGVIWSWWGRSWLRRKLTGFRLSS